MLEISETLVKLTTWSPGIIVNIKGPLRYEVNVDDLTWLRHIDKIRSRVSDSSPTDYNQEM